MAKLKALQQFMSVTKNEWGSGKQRGLYSGDYQIIFVSSLFTDTEMRKLLCTDIYRENLVAYVIDEAQCVLKWNVFIIESLFIFETNFYLFIHSFIHSFIHYLLFIYLFCRDADSGWTFLV